MAERIYLAEVDPLPRMDVVVDNTEFARPRVLGPRRRPSLADREEFDGLVVRTDYAHESAWQDVRAALTEEADFTAYVVDDPAWAGADVDGVLAAVAGDQDLSVVFLADAATMTSAHHGLLAVTTATREECEDDQEYAWLTEFGSRFRTVPAGVHCIHANLSIGNLGFEDYAAEAHGDPEGVFRNHG